MAGAGLPWLLRESVPTGHCRSLIALGRTQPVNDLALWVLGRHDVASDRTEQASRLVDFV